MFVNEKGIYPANFLSAITPVSIKLGKSEFQMYAIDYDLQQDNARKVISVNFIDNTFICKI